MKKVLAIIIIIVILGGGVGGYFLYRANTTVTDVASLYDLTTVSLGTVGQTVSAEGHADGCGTVDLYVDTAQTVKAVNVKVGDAVSPDEELVTYDINKDAKDLNRALTQAQLNLANAQLAAQQTLDMTSADDTNYKIQQNNVQLAQLAVDQVQAQLDKMKTAATSPVTGSVTAVNVSAGGVAGQGAPVISLLDLSKIIVKSDVSEYDAPRLAVGQTADITTSGLPGNVYTGHITKIAGAATAKNSSSDDARVVSVEITIDNADGQLKAGYTVDIVFHTLDVPDALYVPAQAVLNQDGKAFVYKVEGNTLTKTEVTLGVYGDTTVQILSGMSDGDTVASNAAAVRDGGKKPGVSLVG